MSEKRKTLIMLGIVVGIVIIALLIRLFLYNNGVKDLQQGEVVVTEEATEACTMNPTEDYVKADEEYYEARENYVTISDADDVLSQNNFLPVKAHFIRNEQIGAFLAENGYECEQVIVIPNHAEKVDNNSTFYCELPGYDNVLLECVWYGMTEEFRFQIIAKEETTE